MSYRIKKVVVLGSGVMGSGIACHLANVGMDVLMLDIIPSEYSKSKDKKIRNSIADSALMKAIKSKPSPLYEKKNAEKIITGNFTDNFKDISNHDAFFIASPNNSHMEWIDKNPFKGVKYKKVTYDSIYHFSLCCCSYNTAPVAPLRELLAWW